MIKMETSQSMPHFLSTSTLDLSLPPPLTPPIAQARRIPFNLAFTPVSEPSTVTASTPIHPTSGEALSNNQHRCRLLGFTPLTEHTPGSSPSSSRMRTDGFFLGPPQVRAKEVAPCALFFSRADVFVSTEMAAQGLLAPSQSHYSPLQLEMGHPPALFFPGLSTHQAPVASEHEEWVGAEEELRSASSSPAPSARRFWDAATSSTRASSPVSSICGTFSLTLTPASLDEGYHRVRRSRSLFQEDEETGDCWADDELEDGEQEIGWKAFGVSRRSTNDIGPGSGATRRMSEPSGGKPRFGA